MKWEHSGLGSELEVRDDEFHLLKPSVSSQCIINSSSRKRAMQIDSAINIEPERDPNMILK